MNYLSAIARTALFDGLVSVSLGSAYLGLVSAPGPATLLDYAAIGILGVGLGLLAVSAIAGAVVGIRRLVG